MRYVINGAEIKTENAAKPYSQKSSAVDAYLLSLRGKPSILDFGCGKLRYSDTLINVTSKVTFVDSTVQLDREQIIRGEKTTVRSYVKDYYLGCQTVCYEELAGHQDKYDIVTCTNVLSTIPCEKTLLEVMAHIRRLLKKNGFAVFVNQHRNSYFKKYESGEKLLYGYLYKGTRGTSYYGIFDKALVEKMLKKNGYKVLRSWSSGESTFAEATPYFSA